MNEWAWTNTRSAAGPRDLEVESQEVSKVLTWEQPLLAAPRGLETMWLRLRCRQREAFISAVRVAPLGGADRPGMAACGAGQACRRPWGADGAITDSPGLL